MTFEAFQRAVAEHRDRVFGLALYSLRHRQDAEDLTQDVLLRLWRHGDRVPTEHLGPWLLRVTRNACIDAVRRRAVRSRFDAPEEAAVQVAAETPDPEDLAQAEEFQRRLRRALEGLREPYRTVVYLREVQGLKYDEIAATLEIPMARVKVQLHRGRRLLRELLAEPTPARPAERPPTPKRLREAAHAP